MTAVVENEKYGICEDLLGDGTNDVPHKCSLYKSYGVTKGHARGFTFGIIITEWRHK